MILPQPPPGIPAPPPSQQAIRSRRMLSGIISFTMLGAVVLAVSPLLLIKNSHCSFRSQALNNAKQIRLALADFEREYGCFPDTSTAALVAAATGSDLILGSTSSNDFFRQLLAANQGYEKMFEARIKGSKRADNVADKEHALEKGECGFSYIPGYSSSSNPRFPVLVTPLIPGTDRVDLTSLEGKAMLLRLDGSVEEVKVDKAGHVIVFGKRLLDPENPIWEGRSPVIAWPE